MQNETPKTNPDDNTMLPPEQIAHVVMAVTEMRPILMEEGVTDPVAMAHGFAIAAAEICLRSAEDVRIGVHALNQGMNTVLEELLVEQYGPATVTDE